MSPMLATPERLAEQETTAYGPFVPGSAARAVRYENTRCGLRTCWQCLGGYRRREVPDGPVHYPGRGRYFCSVPCRVAWGAEHPLWRSPSRPPTPPPTLDEVASECRRAIRELCQIDETEVET